MRDEFEAWAITSAWLGIGEESQMHQDADGKGYNELEVHTAWLAWQASRAAIVVDLPPSGGDRGCFWQEDVIEAIKAAGLGVKS